MVGNDANVAALGEMWKGAGEGHKNVVMITLGTGVGGGIVIDGRLFPEDLEQPVRLVISRLKGRETFLWMRKTWAFRTVCICDRNCLENYRVIKNNYRVFHA